MENWQITWEGKTAMYDVDYVKEYFIKKRLFGFTWYRKVLDEDENYIELIVEELPDYIVHNGDNYKLVKK